MAFELKPSKTIFPMAAAGAGYGAVDLHGCRIGKGEIESRLAVGILRSSSGAAEGGSDSVASAWKVSCCDVA